MATEPAFPDVPSFVKSNDLETSILAYWETENIFEESLKQNKDKPLYTFYDGPPYATGKPHYGHILQSAIKDTVLRYKTMQGYYVPRRVGWDCHGLPVETLVEKELGFKTKKDIEQYGIEKFNAACRDVVFRYINEFTATLKRIGRWADYDNAYATLDIKYMETEWWVFQQLWHQELVYKAFRSTPYCIRCGTPLSNHEVSLSYKDKRDAAVYVLLPVKEHNNLFLLIWTTTPWTLPGNVAVAMNPDLQYVTVDHEGKHIIVAETRVPTLFKDASIVHRWKSEELQALQYTPPYSFVPVDTNAFRVVAASFVSQTDGSGLVHIAPAFGEEDSEVGKQYNLPTLRTVTTQGKFVSEITPWAEENIFDANPKIIADLKERHLLFKKESYNHNYPFCWRCDTPLIYYALDTWFIAVNRIKDTMLKLNEQIEWVPDHIKNGRFAKGIASAPDWAVSRNRYWSVPVPIWVCDACGEKTCIGSLQELKKVSGIDTLKDIHRPYIDAVTWPCQQCSGTMRRVEEVLDVWFDAGSMPYAQWHYPFENAETVKQSFPADFIVESIEQTRLWFYVLHVLATALTQKDIGLGTHTPAFLHAIGSGLIFAEDGQKLSKKLKNYPEIEPTLEKYGADILRFYLLSSTSLGEPYRFSEKDMRQVQRNVVMTLWNVFSFFVRYANTHGWQPQSPEDAVPTSEHPFDQWIIARTQQLAHDVITESNAYHIDAAARAFIPFIDDLSNWYVRRSRERFQRHTEQTGEAFPTLYYVLITVAKLLAPFMPFMAEEMYRTLTKKRSVHLESLPTDVPSLSENMQSLLRDMHEIRSFISEGLALRARHKFKVRQPLEEVVLVGSSAQTEAVVNALKGSILDELNVKNVRVVSDRTQVPTGDTWAVSNDETNYPVALHIQPSAALKEEGLARDIIRHGQLLRRKAGYALNDRIVLRATSSSPVVQTTLQNQQEFITHALQADTLVDSQDNEDVSGDITLQEGTLHLGMKRP